MVKNRPKIECEICGNTNQQVLHKHHIVERTEINCTNDDFNLAIICANCHSLCHSGQIKIIGIFPSTKLPYGRTLVYVKDGVCNVPGLENSQPYFVPKPKSTIVPFVKDEEDE